MMPIFTVFNLTKTGKHRNKLHYLYGKFTYSIERNKLYIVMYKYMLVVELIKPT